MKRGMAFYLVLICSIVVLPAAALGNGFAINEQDSKAFGMGGAFVAQADNPSAVYFNPAGMVQLDGVQLSAGFALIAPSLTFESNGTSAFGQAGASTDNKDQTFFIPNVYLTWKVNEKWSLGIGEFTNFGLANEWPDDWEGRFITGGTKAEITTMSINPVVAFRPVERLSLALGGVAQYMDITLENKRFLGMGVPEADQKLTGDNWAYGWNLGLLAWITDDVKFGASYRSRIKQKPDGSVKIKGLDKLGLPNVDVGAEGEIELPDILYLGLSWSPGPLTFEFDGQWTGWSSYDTLTATFDQPIFGNTGFEEPKDWSDSWAYRFGVQYALTEAFDLRAGIIYDESPVPDQTVDPLVPAGDRWLYSLGLGYTHGGFALDCGYTYLTGKDREFVNHVGDYNETIAPGLGNVTGEFVDSYAHMFMLNLSYHF